MGECTERIHRLHTNSIKQMKESLNALKRDVSLSIRLCSQDFALLGQELVTSLELKQRQEKRLQRKLQVEKEKRLELLHKCQRQSLGLRSERSMRLFCRIRPDAHGSKPLQSAKHIPNDREDSLSHIKGYRNRTHLVIKKGLTDSKEHRNESIQISSSTNGNVDKKFQFPRVFSETCTQLEIFEEILPVLHPVVYSGSHACIFAYGQTDSGKTYTMQGTNESPGIYHHTGALLFHLIQNQNYCYEFKVSMQIVEIYNDEIYDLVAINCERNAQNLDLLSPSPKGMHAKLEHKCHREIRHGDHGIQLQNVSKVMVESAEEIRSTITTAKKNAKLLSSSTQERSKRSHNIVILDIERKEKGGSTDLDGKQYGRIVLVDLAGSEKLPKTETTHIPRIRDAKCVNKSLAALSDVMIAIEAREKHIPYRNSKLTHLLQETLGHPDRNIVMLVHISPNSSDLKETLNTLKFANRISESQNLHTTEHSEHNETGRLNAIISVQQKQLECLQDKLKQETELKRKYEKRLEDYRLDEAKRRNRDDEDFKNQQNHRGLSPFSSRSALRMSSPASSMDPLPYMTRRWSLYASRNKEHDRYGGNVQPPSTFPMEGQENVNANILSSSKITPGKTFFSPHKKITSIDFGSSKNYSDKRSSEPQVTKTKKRPAVEVRSILKKHRRDDPEQSKSTLSDDIQNLDTPCDSASQRLLSAQSASKQVSFCMSPNPTSLDYSPRKVPMTPSSPYPITASHPLRERVVLAPPRAGRTSVATESITVSSVAGPASRVRTSLPSTPTASRIRTSLTNESKPRWSAGWK
uniref:Kinesin-like protein n=1 Tax=Albugo laibachii Nc14 TaxID=890382 RepID=F0WP83_9STRA|nr:kinesinlike protein putative [Albugo laibachii Nc14]|eukprot:CCA23129.1 kinesinlike protein putative [Albugo laibachii Nc14]